MKSQFPQRGKIQVFSLKTSSLGFILMATVSVFCLGSIYFSLVEFFFPSYTHNMHVVLH